MGELIYLEDHRTMLNTQEEAALDTDIAELLKYINEFIDMDQENCFGYHPVLTHLNTDD